MDEAMFDDFDYFDDEIIDTSSEVFKDQLKREAFDKQFSNYFNPDTSRNTWYDKEYVPRYAGNPVVEKFLAEKGLLLERRGDYISKEAAKGNLEPFVKHSAWLRRQNILPSDARTAKDYFDEFTNKYGFDNTFTGITTHDIYAHAIPETYMGVVDKSMPNNVTGADEARATLIENLGPSIPGLEEKYTPKNLNKALEDVRQSVVKNDPSIYKDFLFSDKSAEYEYLRDNYITKATKAGYFHPLYPGTPLTQIDPRVSDPDTTRSDKYEGTPWADNKPSSISEDLWKGVLDRFPKEDPKSILDFYEKAGAPYIRDLMQSDRLTLAPEVYTNLGPRDYNPKNAKAFLNNALFSLDPMTLTSLGIPEVVSAIKRTPSSLLPGLADLIPSPASIRTGYSKGPVAMGTQMAQEFIQSLPSSAAAAGVLSTPLVAPFALGVGAGLVGTAGARALNEIVRQETGEGIVPKLRQFVGTAPRTGATAQPRLGEQPLTATLKPLTSAQRSEITRQNNRNEIQRRVDLLKERFNPRRGEFGLSELLFGR